MLSLSVAVLRYFSPQLLVGASHGSKIRVPDPNSLSLGARRFRDDSRSSILALHLYSSGTTPSRRHSCNLRLFRMTSHVVSQCLLALSETLYDISSGALAVTGAVLAERIRSVRPISVEIPPLHSLSIVVCITPSKPRALLFVVLDKSDSCRSSSVCHHAPSFLSISLLGA